MSETLRPPLPRSHNELIDMSHRCWENMDSQAAMCLATMAVYEALVLPEYGMSIGEYEQQKRNQGQQ